MPTKKAKATADPPPSAKDDNQKAKATADPSPSAKDDN
jgi:hypothetical protein